ncbi:MAG: TolC family protein [Nibricoccus sp.]
MKRLLVAALITTAALAAEPSPKPLTLDDAVALALKHSKAAQLARLKVDEATSSLDAARRLRYPQITVMGVGAYIQHSTDITVSQGSLTPQLNALGAQLGMSQAAAALGPFPSSDLTIAKGSYTPVIGDLTIAQPLTQLWRINSGVSAAKAGLTENQREAARITAQLRFSVEELFVGVLLGTKRLTENEAKLAAQERKLRDAENAQKVGELLDESVLGMRAAVIQAKSDLTRSRQQLERLSLQLADLIGQPGNDHLTLASDLPTREERPLEHWLSHAKDNPDRQIAAATVEKAASATRAARQARIPELSLIASGYAQDGIPIVPRRSASVGLTLSWDIFDFGRKDAEVARTAAQRRAAEVNRDRIEEDSAREIRLMYQDLTYATELVGLAKQALEYRQRAAQLAHQSTANGLALESASSEADTELRKAEADLAGANYQRHLALLRLYYLSGQF